MAQLTVGTKNKSTREEWLLRVLRDIPKGQRILDAGAGQLQYKKFCNHLEYVSQDFAQYDGTGNNIGLQTREWDNSKLDIVSDVIDIPLPDNSFDAIMCIEVLEHIPRPDLAIKEFSRLLKQTGKLVLTSPFCSLTHYAPYHYSTGFSTYYYKYHLEENGFRIIEIKPNGNYFEYLAQELHRLHDISVKYAGSGLSSESYQAINTLLPQLQTLSEKDTGSSDLLCFGYQVLAEKS